MSKKIFFALLFLMGCSSIHHKKELKVAATAIPHAELLESIQTELRSKGIHLKIVVIDDYQLLNRALCDGEVDANFFQHIPFMQEQIKQFGYPIENYGKIEIEPMGLYSRKISNLSDLKEKSKIAIPNDPTNEGRALLLLQAQGWIQLKDPQNLLATPLDIQSNSKNIEFIEVDAAMLPRTLEDVDLAGINTNFALQAGLSPKDALVLESIDSPYANILVIRISDRDRADLKALKEAMTSENMRAFIEQKYKGAILSLF